MTLLLTPQGDSALRAQFNRLSGVRMQGRAELRDLRDAPRDEQAILEEDIALRLKVTASLVEEIEAGLRAGTIVVPVEQSERVAIGSTVVLTVTLPTGEQEDAKWVIGGYGETHPKVGLIAYTTPLASELLGKQLGDEVEVPFGGARHSATIDQILPPSQGYDQLYPEASTEREGEQL